jgi:hypothetical protein
MIHRALILRSAAQADCMQVLGLLGGRENTGTPSDPANVTTTVGWNASTGIGTSPIAAAIEWNLLAA